jgi:hypothetical protein
MTPRERLGQELFDLSDTVGVDELTEQVSQAWSHCSGRPATG